MAEPKTIRLNGTEFKIRPLTLGQLEELLPLFIQADISSNPKAVSQSIEIVAAALKRDHPEMTAEKLRETETGGIDELVEAVNQIGQLAGLRQPGEAKAGSR